MYIARSAEFAPDEIDGCIYVAARYELELGQSLSLVDIVATDNNKEPITVEADCVGHSNYIHEVVEGIPFDQLHENILRSLEELLVTAEKHGIVLAIENAYNICNTADKLVAAAKYFDSPYLGVCYDAGHANLVHPAFKNCNTPSVDYYWYSHDKVEWDDKMLEKMLPYVVCCHLQDNDGIGDKHWLPGRGNIDWAHIMGLLNKAPRLNSFQCESIPVRESIPICKLCSGFSEFFCLYGKTLG